MKYWILYRALHPSNLQTTAGKFEQKHVETKKDTFENRELYN
jgi:hypothetical protein